MPVAVKCDCGKQLRVSEEHLGKRIRCPACGEALLVEEAKPSKAPARKAADGGATATGGMIAFACSCGKKMQAKGEHAGRTVKCPECGEGVKVPKPGAASQDDEDDEPVSKKLDGLLAGSSRRKAAARDEDEDDEDDRPTSGRRGRDEDEDDPDEDDRPKKGKKSKKKGKGSNLPALLIGGGVLLLLLIGGLVAMYFMGGGSSGAMALVPANAGGFVTVRVGDILATDLGKEALAEMPADAREEMESKFGLALTDIDRVTAVALSLDALAANVGRQPPDGFVVCTAKKAVDQQKVLEALDLKNATASDHKGKKFYVQGSRALYFHDDRTVVGGTPGGVRGAIEQAVNPVTSGPLARLTSQVGSQHLVGGMGVPAALGAMKGQMPPQAAMFAPLLEIQNVLLVGNLSGKNLETTVTGNFGDSKKAEAAKSALDGLKGMIPLLAGNLPPAAQQSLNNLSISASGSDVVLRGTGAIDVATLKQAMGNVGGGRPRPGPGPGPGGGGFGVPADRMRDQNNLKQIGLAFHNLHDATGKMNWAIFSPQGQPLLSWRVALLPYLEHQALYQQIRLNEPWDSPHNSQFHNQMPTVFQLPGRNAGANKTYYQVFVGPGAMFDRNKPQGSSLATIRDGTSNTLLVVEGAQPVNWMQPADLPFIVRPGGMQPRSVAGGRFADGFNACFADGSVKYLRFTMPPRDFQALITASGGEAVTPP